jgi:RNA polymerase sigma factor (sigma-70 family)
VIAYLGLVRSVAARYRDLGLQYDDLVQEGSLGLLEAIDQYDPARSVPFESYARFRIRRAIRNALTDQARLIRLPKHIVERRRAIDRAEAELTAAACGRAPTAGQLADATGLSVAEMLEARAAAPHLISLDESAALGGRSLASLVADPAGSDPEQEALERERVERLGRALEQLPERQRRLVSRRWGLGVAPRSNAELAAELELSPRRLQTLGRDALYELRAALELAESAA